MAEENDVSGVIPQKPTIEPQHVGDAVYLQFDGYQIMVRVNSHENPVVAYINHDVWRGLIRYGQRLGWTP